MFYSAKMSVTMGSKTKDQLPKWVSHFQDQRTEGEKKKKKLLLLLISAHSISF